MLNRFMINRNFFLLWIGKLVSQAGDKFYAIALAWWILQRTNSPLLMGLMMMVSVLPGLLIGPVAGAWIDRFHRKPMMMIPDFIRGLAVTVVAGLSLGGILEVWHVFVVAGIISLNSAFFDPAVQAVIPQIVPDEDLPGANARSQMVGGISTVIGPLLGGVAVSFLGVTTVFLVNGVSYLISGVCSWLMEIPNGSQAINAKPETWREVKAGFTFLARQKRILIIISVIGIAHFFVGSLMVALPFLAKTLAGNGARNLGYLETAMGLGLILGSVFITLRGKTVIRDRALFVFLIIMGLGYGLIGALKGIAILMLIPYLGCLLLVGVVIAGASVYWQSLLQAGVPNEMAGRIFSICAMIGNTSLPLAYGLFGFLLGISSITPVLLSSGICLIVFSGGLMWGYRSFQSSAENGLKLDEIEST